MKLTPEDKAFLAHLLSTLNVNPLQADAEQVISLVRSLMQKVSTYVVEGE